MGLYDFVVRSKQYPWLYFGILFVLCFWGLSVVEGRVENPKAWERRHSLSADVNVMENVLAVCLSDDNSPKDGSIEGKGNRWIIPALCIEFPRVDVVIPGYVDAPRI